MKPVMLGELGSVVEADGLTHRLWKLAELTGDGPSGEDCFSIDRMLNHAEAGLSFVAATLANRANSMKSVFPVAWDLAAFDLGGPVR